jgi:hypothetical protein
MGRWAVARWGEVNREAMGVTAQPRAKHRLRVACRKAFYHGERGGVYTVWEAGIVS